MSARGTPDPSLSLLRKEENSNFYRTVPYRTDGKDRRDSKGHGFTGLVSNDTTRRSRDVQKKRGNQKNLRIVKLVWNEHLRKTSTWNP